MGHADDLLEDDDAGAIDVRCDVCGAKWKYDIQRPASMFCPNGHQDAEPISDPA